MFFALGFLGKGNRQTPILNLLILSVKGDQIFDDRGSIVRQPLDSLTLFGLAPVSWTGS